MDKHIDTRLFDGEDPLDISNLYGENLGNASLRGDVEAIRNYILSEAKKTSQNYTTLRRSINRKFDILINHMNGQLKKIEEAYKKLNTKLKNTEKQVADLTSKHQKVLLELERRNNNFKKIIDEQKIKLHTTTETLKKLKKDNPNNFA